MQFGIRTIIQKMSQSLIRNIILQFEFKKISNFSLLLLIKVLLIKEKVSFYRNQKRHFISEIKMMAKIHLHNQFSNRSGSIIAHTDPENRPKNPNAHRNYQTSLITS